MNRLWLRASIGIGVMVAPLFAFMYAGVFVLEAYWTPSIGWQLPYLFGMLVAGAYAVVISHLFTTATGWRIVRPIVYAEAYLDTLHFPVDPPDGDSP